MTGLHAARILLRSVNFVLVMQHPCSQDLSPLDPNLWSICIELEGSSFSVVDRYSGDCCRSYDAVPMLWPYQFPECGRHWCPSCWRSSENMCLGVSDVWLCKIKCWKSVYTSRNIYIYVHTCTYTCRRVFEFGSQISQDFKSNFMLLQVLTFWRLRSIRLRRLTGGQQPQGRNRRRPGDGCNKGCNKVNQILNWQQDTACNVTASVHMWALTPYKTKNSFCRSLFWAWCNCSV